MIPMGRDVTGFEKMFARFFPKFFMQTKSDVYS